MAKDVNITIKAIMDERWIDDFCSMLKWMENCGNVGHSSVTGFYVDGDGDFRPKFEFDREFEKKEGYRNDIGDDGSSILPELEIIFDAVL